MTLSPPVSSRRVACAALVALLALAGAIGTAPASASATAGAKAKGCAGQVVNDWYNSKDRRVHGHYPLHCYREALDSLGSDVGDYTNAKDAISQALAAEALRNGGGPGGPGAGPAPRKLHKGEKRIAFHNTYDFGLFDPVQGPDPTAPVSTTSPSSVPVPLIVLAGLAVVLLLAGGGSYLARRVKASRTAPPATDP